MLSYDGTNGKTVIGLAKGELGRNTEVYLREHYDIKVCVENRPVNFRQVIGDIAFVPMRSSDVSAYTSGSMEDSNGNPVETDGIYGITGEDFALQYGLTRPRRIKVIERLGFGRGDLVLFSKHPVLDIINSGKPAVVAVAKRYSDFVEHGEVGKYLADTFGDDYKILPVEDSVETFVRNEIAHVGFDFSTYCRRPKDERPMTTLGTNGLAPFEVMLPTEAVVIARNSPEYILKRFEENLKEAKTDERRKREIATQMIPLRKRLWKMAIDLTTEV